jgi:hypothetical protein
MIKRTGQVIAALQRLRVLRAEHILFELDQCPIFRFRLGIFALVIKRNGQTIAAARSTVSEKIHIQFFLRAFPDPFSDKEWSEM